MKGTFQTENPNEIEFTLTLTMTLGKWKELQKQLSDKWPSWEFSGIINSMVFQAQAVYTPKEQE